METNFDNPSDTYGELTVSQMMEYPGFRIDIMKMNLIKVQCCKLFIAISRVARIVDTNTKELGTFTAETIALDEVVDVVDRTPTPGYNPRAKLTADDPQFYAIYYNKRAYMCFDEQKQLGLFFMAYANDPLGIMDIDGEAIVPNVKLSMDNGTHNLVFLATRDIQVGEELVWEYDTTGQWWHDREPFIDNLVYQQAMSKYPKLKSDSGSAGVRREVAQSDSSYTLVIKRVAVWDHQRRMKREFEHREKVIRFGFQILEEGFAYPYKKKPVTVEGDKKWAIVHQLEWHIKKALLLAKEDEISTIVAGGLQFEFKRKGFTTSRDFVTYKRKNFKEKYAKATSNRILNLEFIAIQKYVYEKLWYFMDKCEWKNFLALDSKKKSGFPLYISLQTTAEIIYRINQYFGPLDKYDKFTHYVDIGVGIPYLVASIQYFFESVQVFGADFDTTVNEIEKKIRATPEGMLDTLRKIYFVAGDILRLNPRDTLMTYVLKCEVITNFIGDESIDEFMINQILPSSKCKLAMFRCNHEQFNAQNHDSLVALGFMRDQDDFKGYLYGGQKESFDIVIYQKEKSGIETREAVLLPKYIDLTAARTEDIPELVDSFFGAMPEDDPKLDAFCVSFLDFLKAKNLLGKFGVVDCSTADNDNRSRISVRAVHEKAGKIDKGEDDLVDDEDFGVASDIYTFGENDDMILSLHDMVDEGNDIVLRSKRKRLKDDVTGLRRKRKESMAGSDFDGEVEWEDSAPGEGHCGDEHLPENANAEMSAIPANADAAVGDITTIESGVKLSADADVSTVNPGDKKGMCMTTSATPVPDVGYSGDEHLPENANAEMSAVVPANADAAVGDITTIESGVNDGCFCYYYC